MNKPLARFSRLLRRGGGAAGPLLWMLLCVVLSLAAACGRSPHYSKVLQETGLTRGICVLPGDENCDLAAQLAGRYDFLIYVQLPGAAEVEAARRTAHDLGLYGTRIFVEQGSYDRIHLADGIADLLIAAGPQVDLSDQEALRVVRPEGVVLMNNRRLTKPFPEGVDDWSHPYHGPDNNTMSKDELIRAPYLTRFLAEPYYAPLPQVAVASGGRVFKAFGNMAFHLREEALLNTLVAFNGYNGTMLWKRNLTPGFMIHRSTMIATPEILFLGDDKSCKKIDTETGQLLDEIIPPTEVAGGTCWKWMALDGGVLYALLGEAEQNDGTIRQRTQSHGWPWYPLSKGFNQKENPWGFGRDLLAMDADDHKILWHHHEKEEIDSRALCMKSGKIYLFRFGAYLACIDSESGAEIWRRTPENAPDLFEALGTYLDRQDYRTNWRTTAYLKCSDQALYFSGPSIDKLLAVSAKDGKVLWQNPYSNFQLVLHDKGLYGISGQVDNAPSFRFDPLTGEVLEQIDTKRRACARPSGTADAILYRAEGGSVRLDVEGGEQLWISPMRAQCQDGVTVANGLLYWWPMVCDCQNTLYGVTCLGPAGEFDFYRPARIEERLEKVRDNVRDVVELETDNSDWPTFRADNSCRVTVEAELPQECSRLWWYNPNATFRPTAPVTGGGLVFTGGSDGVVRALEAESGELKWKAFTGGAVRIAPTLWQGRLYAGSADGWVYAFEARSGELLWRFNAAPQNRKIPVYGKLMSTWPVTSGVLIQDGVAYFAAGIANYDGTYVYALDAVSGEIVWHNNSSGHLDREARTGASVQGHLLINDGKLYMASGTSFSPAVYDISDGRCLNDPAPLKNCASNCSRGWELSKVGDHVVVGGQPYYGHPDYPVYDPTVTNTILHTSIKNRDIVCLNKRAIRCYSPIPAETLNRCVIPAEEKPYFMNRGWGTLDVPQSPLWEYGNGKVAALAVAANAVVAAYEIDSGGIPSIEIIDLESGMPWTNAGGRKIRHRLLCPPVSWGLALDREGRIFVSLENGQVMCFGESI